MLGLFKRRHKYTNRIFRVLLEKNFDGTYINKIYQEDHTLHVNIHLPEKKERSDLEGLLSNLQEEIGATAVKIGKVSGKSVEILFGMKELGTKEKPTLFSSSLLHMGTLKVELPSAYGSYILDFEDGSSFHLLNGGATRMGKTTFIQYFSTTLFLQMKGDIDMYIVSTKLKDFYFFDGVPQVKLIREHTDTMIALERIIKEYQKRDKLLHTPQLRKATDAKSVREHYPQYAHQFKPVFLIIDEFARFADNKPLRKLVEEIVETAGYVNVHVIIASQRPDVMTVLTARIRANLLVRMALPVADENNRKVILGVEGVPCQGKIVGRALLLDGELNTVQIPYLQPTKADELLEEYRHEESGERQIDNQLPNEVQGDEPQSVSVDDMQGELQSSECREQGIEAYDIEWVNPTGTKGEG